MPQIPQNVPLSKESLQPEEKKMYSYCMSEPFTIDDCLFIAKVINFTCKKNAIKKFMIRNVCKLRWNAKLLKQYHQFNFLPLVDIQMIELGGVTVQKWLSAILCCDEIIPNVHLEIVTSYVCDSFYWDEKLSKMIIVDELPTIWSNAPPRVRHLFVSLYNAVMNKAYLKIVLPDAFQQQTEASQEYLYSDDEEQDENNKNENENDENETNEDENRNENRNENGDENNEEKKHEPTKNNDVPPEEKFVFYAKQVVEIVQQKLAERLPMDKRQWVMELYHVPACDVVLLESEDNEFTLKENCDSRKIIAALRKVGGFHIRAIKRVKTDLRDGFIMVTCFSKKCNENDNGNKDDFVDIYEVDCRP